MTAAGAKNKTVLVVSQCLYPEEFRINDLCAAFVKEGYTVQAVTAIPNYPQGDFYPGYGLFRRHTEEWQGVRIRHLPIIPRKRGSVMLALNYLSFVISGGLWQRFTSLRADRVFIFETSPMTQALIGVRYAKRFGIPCEMYVQDLWPDNVAVVAGVQNRLILGALHRMTNYIYRNCTRIYATSPSFRRVIERRVTADRAYRTAHGRTVPYDAPEVLYWPQYAEALYRPVSQRQPDGTLRIMFTGNVGVAQGLEILPKAAGLLDGEAVTFHIVGDGRQMEAFQAAVRGEGVEKRFVFHGRQKAEDIPSFLADADVAFCSFMDTPLFARTIPAKLQSYLACGMPVLAVAGGETKRIVKEADCGWVSPLGDAVALAGVIREILLTPADEVTKKRENALRYSRAHFEKEALLKQLYAHWAQDALQT